MRSDLDTPSATDASIERPMKNRFPPAEIRPERFDYIKLGAWVEARGPLTSPTTNQRIYRVGPDGSMEDITARFQRK